MTSIEKNLRAARILYFTLLVMVVVALDVSYRTAPAQRQISLIMVYAVVFICVNDIVVAAFLRARMIRPSEESLRSNPGDESTLKKWRTGVFVSLIMAYTTILLGLVLKLNGATWNIASWFFIVGILNLLAWTPRLHVSAD